MEYLEKIKKTCDKIDKKQIEKVVKILEKALEEDRVIFVCGNGGSAATASHMVCDLVKTSSETFRVICLNDNTPMMTAVANDFDYKDVFSFQLVCFANEGDLLIAISGSGDSKNIVEVVDMAKKKGMETIAFLGMDGGKVKDMVDECILVPSNDYGLIEDFHLILVHLITEHFSDNRHRL